MSINHAKISDPVRRAQKRVVRWEFIMIQSNKYNERYLKDILTIRKEKCHTFSLYHVFCALRENIFQENIYGY